MKKSILFIALAMMVGLCSCGKKSSQIEAMSAQQAIAQAESLVDTEVAVEGQCVGVCHHTGRKAFLQDEDGNILLVTAGDDMDAFDMDCVGKTICVQGMMRSFIPEQPAEEAAEEATEAVEEQASAEEQAECEAPTTEGTENKCCESEAQAMESPIIYYVEASTYTIR